MSLLLIGWTIIITACFTLAIQHLVLWFNYRKDLSNLLFSFTAIGAGLSAIIEILQLQTSTIVAYQHLVRIGHIPIYILLVSLVWFVDIYFGTAKRWLTTIITTLWSIALVINFTSEYNLTFESITEIIRIPLLWGEEFSIPVGIANSWKYVADLASILILLFISDASIRLWKNGNKRRAFIVGGSIILFILMAGIHTPLVDEGIVKTPYLVSFAFLGIIVAMSIELINDILRIPLLSKKVLSQDIRWKSLLNNMKVAVIEVNSKGEIIFVNPFHQQFFGHNEDEIIGKHYSELLSNEENDDLSNFSESIQENNDIPPFKMQMHGTGSELKVINWNVVRIYDAEKNWISTLSVGIDITDQQNAFDEIRELKERLEHENIVLREEIQYTLDSNKILGSSNVLRYSLSRVQQVASTDTTVLLEGETGVGKELFARLIHSESSRNQKPFIKINCAAIPSNLLESELFGHEKGAFTGASSARKGRFENADNATLFLDEIGELPLELQPKLLRVLEEGEFEKLGSNETIKVNVRIITATNRILDNEVANGSFREDLFYRINNFPISIPSLRKRKEDIPLLVESFVNTFSRKLGKTISEIPNETMETLKNYDWPGNVRELRNVIERAVITTDTKVLTLADKLRSSQQKNAENLKSLEQLEYDYIKKVLEACNWKIEGKGGAAEILEIHPNTLRSKIKKLRIKKKT